MPGDSFSLTTLLLHLFTVETARWLSVCQTVALRTVMLSSDTRQLSTSNCLSHLSEKQDMLLVLGLWGLGFEPIDLSNSLVEYVSKMVKRKCAGPTKLCVLRSEPRQPKFSPSRWVADRPVVDGGLKYVKMSVRRSVLLCVHRDRTDY